MDDKVSVIPVGADNVIIDGAHRVATSAFFHRRVPIIRFSWISIDYGADFFLKRGLPRGYTDYCTSELIKTYGGKNMHVAILWPRADENRENVETVERIFQEKTELFYKQELDCNYNMIRNLVILCYYHTESREDWLGNFLNCFRGADGKAFCCYARGKTVRVYYFIKDSSEDVLSLKENIRKMFCVGNHSCHISDTPQEAMFIAEMLCNCNSVDLLKYGFPGSVGNLANSLRKIRDMSEKNGVKQGSYVIDSSGVLGLYGMRKVSDLDFISRCPDETLIRGIGDSHNEYLCYYGVSADELTMNPKNYLWFMGMKFSSLEMVKRLKVNRKEDDVSKDVIDVMMIDAVFNKRLGDLYDTPKSVKLKC